MCVCVGRVDEDKKRGEWITQRKANDMEFKIYAGEIRIRAARLLALARKADEAKLRIDRVAVARTLDAERFELQDLHLRIENDLRRTPRRRVLSALKKREVPTPSIR